MREKPNKSLDSKKKKSKNVIIRTCVQSFLYATTFIQNTNFYSSHHCNAFKNYLSHKI